MLLFYYKCGNKAETCFKEAITLLPVLSVQVLIQILQPSSVSHCKRAALIIKFSFSYLICFLCTMFTKYY